MIRFLRPSNNDDIFDPAPNRILVFGSNLAGIHAVGASRYAYKWCGAEWDKGEGFTGSSYAIPVENLHLQLFPLEKIKKYIDNFILFAWEHKELIFFIMRLGCGYREYRDDQIAPLFLDAPPNCTFPIPWRRFYSEIEQEV